MNNLSTNQQMKLIKEFERRDVSSESVDKIIEGLTELINVTGRGIDEGTEETPFRMFKALLELTKGECENPRYHLQKTFEADSSEVVIVKDIEFNSLCEHHVMPFFGKVHIAYIPQGRVVGLSKFARLVEGYSKRLQIQERLTSQIANAIQEELKPLGVMVIVEAEHTCMSLRGIRNKGSKTVTVQTHGQFNILSKRAEVLELIK